MSNIPDKFAVNNMEFNKSITKEGMYRFKDEHGNTGYISEKEAEKIYKNIK
jgi:hypothetical protein